MLEVGAFLRQSVLSSRDASVSHTTDSPLRPSPLTPQLLPQLSLAVVYVSIVNKHRHLSHCVVLPVMHPITLLVALDPS